VKFTTFGVGKARDWEDGQSYGSNVDQGFFCGVGFSISMAPSEMMPHMSRDHESWAIDDGNHVMVPNPNEMIFTTTPLTRTNARLP
jgi:hypothetical protein